MYHFPKIKETIHHGVRQRISPDPRLIYQVVDLRTHQNYLERRNSIRLNHHKQNFNSFKSKFRKLNEKIPAKLKAFRPNQNVYVLLPSLFSEKPHHQQ